LHRLPDEVTGTQGAWVEPTSFSASSIRHLAQTPFGKSG
jgi:hypothetical protein